MISVSAALFDPGSRFNNNVVAGAVYASQILFFFISSMVAVFRPVDPNVRVLGSAVLVGTLLLLTATIQKIRSVRSSHLSQLERQELLQKLEEHYNELNETLRDFAVETARKNEECPPVGSNPADIVVCGNARSRRTSRLVLGLTVGVAAAAVVGVGFGLRQIGKAQGNQKS
ncbi:hypothetical protein Asera_20560 [Actinocatenispora sera]|uniref:Uncharacterized protein n=2 Tax=Actinocatenispora sera TaxID=390989 RepID=A0A810L167_9ACTN|nr:hypothetical protein Asera_20560 [Actinocatenispora sera]